MCIFRALSPAELENILQSWVPGKESAIWVSLDIVLGLLPELCRDDFKSYMKLGYGQYAVERGFFLHEKDRKVDAIYVFDCAEARVSHAQSKKVSEPPNVRLWLQFLDIFQALYLLTVGPFQ